mgnify:CR=1 FL=1
MTVTQVAPFTCQKDQFQLDDSAHYLNCAYLGPIPRSVEMAGITGLQTKRSPTPFPSSEFFSGCNHLRERFAALVGGTSERVAIMPSASYGVTAAARNLPLGRGQRIVILGEQFPSNVYIWRRLAVENECELFTVHRPGPPPSAARWNERLLDAIRPGTAVVALPHCHWTDGTRIDLVAVGKRAREVGAALVVDGSQSIGAVPFDLDEIQPDALITVGYKWLLGPYSMALAHFGERFDDGIPLEENCFAREGSDDFQALVDYTDQYRPGAVRYDVGETANFILVPMMIEALDCISAWEPADIRAYCVALLESLTNELREKGWAMEDDFWRTGHMLGVRLPEGWELDSLQARLVEAGVYCSLRGDALRISPHVYNDASDIDALREVLLSFST